MIQVNDAAKEGLSSPTPEPTGDKGDRAGQITARQYLWALVSEPFVLLSVIFILVLLICAVFAPWIAPYDPLQQNILGGQRQPPMSELRFRGVERLHILGTDEVGRDVLSRLIHGARVSVSIAVIGVLVSGVIGVTLGLLAGFYRGWIDDVIMRLVDGFMAIPSLLIALVILFLIGGGLFNLILVFAVVRWMVYARLTRGIVLGFRESAFVEAARAIGASDARIIFRHILPNMASPILVLATLELALLILAEASLSFLGFGIAPPDASWGRMIERGRDYMRDAWWLVVMPGLAIFLTTLSLNLIANWLRTITDPVQRWRWLT